ncbi:MAG TPA: hypothetical protein VGG39_24935 [Polyangiaceae bacterium]|jgi:hypothetical protein
MRTHHADGPNFSAAAALIEQLPGPQPRKRDVWRDTAKAMGGYVAEPTTAPAPVVPEVALHRVELVDIDAVKAIDPLLGHGSVVRLAAPWTEPVSLGQGGRELLRLVPADAGQPAGDLPWDVYAMLVEQFGAEPMAPAGEWDAEAEARAGAALVVLPTHDLAQWRGEERARRTMIADELRGSFLVSAEAAARIAGAEPPSKSLWTGQAAARLAEAKREREEVARVAASTAAAVRVEAARDRTVGELHLVAVAVRRERLGVPFPSEPWAGARVLWRSDEEDVYGFRAVPAMHAAAFDADGVRLLDATEIVPRDAAEALDADNAAIEFLRARRSECEDLDFGAVDKHFHAAPPLAEGLARAFAPVILSGRPSSAWRFDWLCELLVRCGDFMLRPDVGCRLLLGELDVAFRKSHPPVRVPAPGALRFDFEQRVVGPRTHKEVAAFVEEELPSRTMLGVVGTRLVQATTRGEFVARGEPLEPPPSETQTQTKTTTTTTKHKGG